MSTARPRTGALAGAAELPRRRVLVRCAGLLLGAGAALGVRGQPAPRVVPVQVSKFAFAPGEILATAGQPLTLLLAATDFPHGFGIPEFGLRRDLVPGQTVELRFTPTRPGRFHVLCDNFCGEGHDRMSGWLVVAAA